MNSWIQSIKRWGQAAVDGEIIVMDSTDRGELFDAVTESLVAKENTQGIETASYSDLKNPKLVLLPLSGGLDSLVAYERAKELGYEVRPYFVRLRTPYSNIEENIVKDLVPEVKIINHEEWPKRWEPYKTRWRHILPLRNLLIILSIAERSGDRPGEIWLGATEGEIPATKGDKSLKFFLAVDTLLNTLPVKHRLEFPLRSETKTELVAWWLHSGRDLERLTATITCQSPSNEPGSRWQACGQCHACFNRWIAMRNNGINEDLVADPRDISANQEKILAFKEALQAKNFDTWSERRILQTLKAWYSEDEDYPRATSVMDLLSQLGY